MPSRTPTIGSGGTAVHNPSTAPGAQDSPGETERMGVSGVPKQRDGQLTQLRLDQSQARQKREVPPGDTLQTAGPQRNSHVFPAPSAAEKADVKARKALAHWLKTGKLNANPIPANASIKPFVDTFKDSVREPQVQAWLKSKGLDVSTVRVFSDAVEGVVEVDGEKVIRRFTTTDGSGWWEVGAAVSEAVKALHSGYIGVALPLEKTGEFLDANVLFNFYGLEAPKRQEDRTRIYDLLTKEGWPAISDEKRSHWRLQFEQLQQKTSDIDVRSRLASQLQALLKEKGEQGVSDLSQQRAVIYPESSLAQKSQVPRDRFVDWLAAPVFKAFIEKIGFGAGENVYRISDGNLELRDSGNQWVSLQRYLEDEISKVSVGGNPAEKAAINKLSAEFDQLVAMSRTTGNALYASATYDVRQVLEFSGLGSPGTATELNSVIGWLTSKLPPSPVVGDYAGLSPYAWAPGALSSSDFAVLREKSTGVGSVTQLLVSHMSRQDLPNDPHLQLQVFFDSPQGTAKAQELAVLLNMVEVADGKPLSRATRHQLLASAIKASVTTQMPGKPGVVAGYEIYQPGNLGRTLDEVRGDVETHLKSKGANAKTASLIAHMLLAQAAPEFLLKPDPALPSDAPAALKLSPGQVSIGSVSWMNLRLGCAMAETLGGAGSSRSLNITQAQTLARLDPMGAEQEQLIKTIGAPPLLDWAVMNGVFPKTSDGRYSPGDYKAAAQAFADRESSVYNAFQSMTREPVNQTSLLVDQLAVLFPEMTKDEIRRFKLELDTNVPFNPRQHAHLETRQPLLTEVILAGQAKLDPLFTFQKWLNELVSGEKKYKFSHPKISQETFNERIKSLPQIPPLVGPAVDQYLADSRTAHETMIRLMIANAPLDVRKGLEAGDVEIFTLREETGEPLDQDQGKDSKVSEKRARRGVLLRYKTEGTTDGYTYLEMFPGSMKMYKRYLVFSKLELNGVIQKGQVPGPGFSYSREDFRKTAPVDFDLQAYQTGDQPRPGVRTNAIIEKFGETLPGRAQTLRFAQAPGFTPNSWSSTKTRDIAKAVVDATFDVKREPLVEYANQPTALQKRRSYPFDSGKVFTKDNLKTVLSLIPFVGAIADIADGNFGAGLKGLLIDFASFAVTGGIAGAKNFYKGLKAVVPFGTRAFRMGAMTGATPFFRSLFNPLDGAVDVLKAGPKLIAAAKKVLAGELVNMGEGVFMATTAFEKCRWGLGVYDTLAPVAAGQAASAYPERRVGVSQSCALYAVQVNGNWYAIDPVSRKPTGAPLADFKPDAPVS
ncbi:hypothetical protein [Pseudomonas costantinii]|nr:hypothetical protein [Pseudomonas costantinii]NVZ21505.1 hypothetical protein [Pseudomonas costantinii]